MKFKYNFINITDNMLEHVYIKHKNWKCKYVMKEIQ